MFFQIVRFLDFLRDHQDCSIQTIVVMVEKDGFEGQHIDQWLEKARIFAESLPSKPAWL